MSHVLSKSFESPLTIPEMFEALRGVAGIAWRMSESFYIGTHVSGKTADGIEIDIVDPAATDSDYRSVSGTPKKGGKFEIELSFPIEQLDNE